MVDYQVEEGDGGVWISLQDILQLPSSMFVPLDLGVIVHFVVGQR